MKDEAAPGADWTGDPGISHTPPPLALSLSHSDSAACLDKVTVNDVSQLDWESAASIHSDSGANKSL